MQLGVMTSPVARVVQCVGVVLLLLSGCRTVPVPAAKPTAPAMEAVPGTVVRGQASWYGDAYRGKKTASGERFNPDELTAAHRTLAFGQWVQVRSLVTNKTAVVRINDRGPFIAGRIIDLSEAAARQIGMINAGVVPVEVVLLRPRRR